MLKKISTLVLSFILLSNLNVTSVLANTKSYDKNNNHVSENEVQNDVIVPRLAGAEAYDIPLSSIGGAGDESGNSVIADNEICKYSNLGVKLKINHLYDENGANISSLLSNEKVVIAIYSGVTRVFYREVYGASIGTLYEFPEVKVTAGSKLRAYAYLRSPNQNILGQARLILYYY